MTRSTLPFLAPVRSLPTLLAAVLVLSAAVIAGGCASTQPTRVQLDDTALKAEVVSRLAAHPDLSAMDIEVDVNERVVRIFGIVEDPLVPARAEAFVAQIDGVARVINDLRVGEETAGDRLDDAGVTARVKLRITADPDLNPFDINVSTDGGVVTLMGRVRSAAAKQRAEVVARETSGVRGVNNLLEVGELTGGGG